MTLITSTQDLISFCERASSSSYITVDTEFVRETTYWPQLCLIQVGLAHEAVAIDPLAPGIDLTSFFALLQNPDVLKVVHSGRQDVEIFYHLTGEIPKPLFDTQIAAMVCGFGEAVAYDALVQRYAKVSIDKSSRYTHWAQRPLTEKQLTYALGDVTHLRVIYEKLVKRLQEEDRTHWVEDEVEILTNPATYAVDPSTLWQKIKVRSATPRLLAILRDLAAWRDLMAKQRNVPRARVLRDEALLDLAASAPRSLADLERMRGVPPSLAKGKEGTVILGLIEKALALPVDQCPPVKQNHESPPGTSALIEMLRLLLKLQSDKYQVAQKLIATSADIEEIARSSAPQVPALSGWRNDIFGKTAMALKQGKVGFGLQDNKITLIPLP